MFNKLQYRLNKKINHLRTINRLKLINTVNFLLIKNTRLHYYRQIAMFTKTRVLLSGRRNVCSITGNYRAVFNSLQVSRHVYRSLGDTSMLPNFSKTSWLCLSIVYL